MLFYFRLKTRREKLWIIGSCSLDGHKVKYSAEKPIKGLDQKITVTF